MHHELQGASRTALSYDSVGQGRLVDVHPSTAWCWGKASVRRAEELGGESARAQDRYTHPGPHPDEWHPDQLSEPLAEHSSIQMTLIYLELVPDPVGSLDPVP